MASVYVRLAKLRLYGTLALAVGMSLAAFTNLAPILMVCLRDGSDAILPLSSFIVTSAYAAVAGWREFMSARDDMAMAEALASCGDNGDKPAPLARAA